jgi:hypothetical protein
MSVTQCLPKNRILDGLPSLERETIMPSCEVADMHLGDVIEEAGRPIRFLHFPIESAISITNMQDQQHIVEVTVTGKEGCADASIVLGNDRSPCMAMVQIGGTAIRIPATDVLSRQSRLPYLHAALAQYNLLVMNLAVISVGCSQFHSPSQRLARWLKTHWHRRGIKSFPFSSDFLAAQVGVESKLVGEMLDDFQRKCIVQRGRNKVTITNQESLQRHACRCYAMAKASTEEYMGGLVELAKAHRHS